MCVICTFEGFIGALQATLVVPLQLQRGNGRLCYTRQVELICGKDALEKVKLAQAEYDERMSKPMFQSTDLNLDLDALFPKTE